MNSLERFAVAWTIMWGMSYIVTALFAPEITGDTTLVGTLLFSILGTLILITLILLHTKRERIGKFLFGVLGCMMTFGGVASWTGLVRWNVPFVVVDLFQVSMAFADLISAVFMFVLATTEEVRV